MAAQLKPDGGRSRLLSRRSRATRTRPCVGPRARGRTSPSSISDCRFASRSGRLVAASSGAAATRTKGRPGLAPVQLAPPTPSATKQQPWRAGVVAADGSLGHRQEVGICSAPPLLRSSISKLNLWFGGLPNPCASRGCVGGLRRPMFVVLSLQGARRVLRSPRFVTEQVRALHYPAPCLWRIARRS